MPSAYSTSTFRPLPSSMVMTPSRPTFSMALASRWPIAASLAAIVATCSISCFRLTGMARRLISPTTAATAASMPLLSNIGLAPAARLRRPSVTIDWASTVAVVVPSPATSLVLVAACLSIWAPMFWKWLSSSISLATVTPSCVTVGAPHFLSRATLRPRGPRVTLTALARASIPDLSCRRASASKMRSLAGMYSPCPYLFLAAFAVGNNREQVRFADDELILAVELDFGAAVLGEQHLVARLDVHFYALAVFQHAA